MIFLIVGRNPGAGEIMLDHAAPAALGRDVQIVAHVVVFDFFELVFIGVNNAAGIGSDEIVIAFVAMLDSQQLVVLGVRTRFSRIG